MKTNKLFLFFGPPGAGKGTLAAHCVNDFGWLHVSTGDLCREHIKQGTDIGLQIKSLTEKGLLVSDDIIIEMIKRSFVQHKNNVENIILDGFPRTKKQAEALLSMLNTYKLDMQIILVKICVNAELLIDRIVNRALCSNVSCGKIYSTDEKSEMKPKVAMQCDICSQSLIKRVDDTRELLQSRLNVYVQHEQDILNFYIQKGFDVKLLNGDQAIQHVFEDFKRIV